MVTIDHSLTMQGSFDSGLSRLEAAKRAATNLISHLAPQIDQVGLVLYAGTTELRETLTTNFTRVITNIMSTGGSNYTYMYHRPDECTCGTHEQPPQPGCATGHRGVYRRR